MARKRPPALPKISARAFATANFPSSCRGSNDANFSIERVFPPKSGSRFSGSWPRALLIERAQSVKAAECILDIGREKRLFDKGRAVGARPFGDGLILGRRYQHHADGPFLPPEFGERLEPGKVRHVVIEKDDVEVAL